MAHLIQVGAGSGGMPVLDMVARDPRVTRVTLIEPDVYRPHNVERHLFPHSDVGELKAVLAENWLRARRPDLEIHVMPWDLLDPARQPDIEQVVAVADLGICAADNEVAKIHWDGLMRKHARPWTLGEVLSGGIGGFVHWFVPGGPCYGCVASHLQRSLTLDTAKAPDYSQPAAAIEESTIPASKAAIGVIASLHAVVTLGLLADPTGYAPGFTSMLWSLQKVAGVFDEAFRPYRFRIPRAENCLFCQAGPTPPCPPEDLDVALDQALARLGGQ